MVSVKASETAPRVAPNSACTTGSTTTTDHIPTLPTERDQQRQRKPDPCPTRVGRESVESVWIGGRVHGSNFVGSASGSSSIGAILGMQMWRSGVPAPLMAARR